MKEWDGVYDSYEYINSVGQKELLTYRGDKLVGGLIKVYKQTFPKAIEVDYTLIEFKDNGPDTLHLFTFKIGLKPDQLVYYGSASDNLDSTILKAVRKWSNSKYIKEEVKFAFPNQKQFVHSAILPISFNQRGINTSSYYRHEDSKVTYPKSNTYSYETSDRNVWVTGLSEEVGPGASSAINELWAQPVIESDLIRDILGADLKLKKFAIQVNNIQLKPGMHQTHPLYISDNILAFMKDYLKTRLEIFARTNGVPYQTLIKTIKKESLKVDLISNATPGKYNPEESQKFIEAIVIKDVHFFKAKPFAASKKWLQQVSQRCRKLLSSNN